MKKEWPSDDEKVLYSLKRDLDLTKRVPEKSYWSSCFISCRDPKSSRIQNKLLRNIDKELDLEKTIYRLRLLAFNAIGSMSKDQSIFVDRISRIVVNESSNLDYTSSDKELKENKDRGDYIRSA